MMWQEERHKRIRALLSALSNVSTDRVARELGVSRETVRRDFVILESLGVLRRAHGGAVATSSGGPGRPGAAGARHERAIAKAAAGLVGDGATVFVDTGPLAVLLVGELGALRDVTLITHGIAVAQRANALARPDELGGRVILLGGALDSSGAATVGDHTLAEVHRLRADLAFTCPDGVDARHGASRHDLAHAELLRAMAANAAQVVVMADYDRIGVSSRVSYCPVDRIAHVVTHRRAQGVEGYEALAASTDILLA
jgi:DeoR/GlpR family transcriptional regulator of sugar metabolism